jgi:deoxyribodipyrimidine photo-lyase
VSTSNTQPTTLVWFRRDLRIQNNPALDYAVQRGGRVIPIYIEYSNNIKDWQPGAASRWWCHHSLKELADSLQQQGLKLRFFSGEPLKIFTQLIKQTGATAIAWNNLYEQTERDLEARVSSACDDCEIYQANSSLLFVPGSLLNKSEQPYRVFTPFWKQARADLEMTGVSITRPKKYSAANQSKARLQGECTLAQLGLLDEHPWHHKLQQHWQPGEASAQQELKQFIEHAAADYDIDRDIPSVDGTSCLSAHLHFGEITPAQIVYTLQQYEFDRDGKKSIERFISELGWREFAHHVLWHFPYTANQCMNEKFNGFWPSRANQKLLTQWQTGNTGVPLVDAGMRQLWETGWMHNRVRMIVGSFLTKNLGIHWLHGAKWFWDTLVDADLASNTLGWQWVAGCGVDAAPYYRIFNPDTQAKRFDPDLTYIKEWVPEIDELGYMPVIDLAKSREEALSRYKSYNAA